MIVYTILPTPAPRINKKEKWSYRYLRILKVSYIVCVPEVAYITVLNITNYSCYCYSQIQIHAASRNHKLS